MHLLALFRFWLILLVLIVGMPGSVFACCCVDEPVKTRGSSHDCCDSDEQTPERQGPEQCEDCACNLRIAVQHAVPMALTEKQFPWINESSVLLSDCDSLFRSIKEKVPTPPPRLQA